MKRMKSESKSSKPSYRIAVDIGGTFTDLLILDEERQRCRVGKVLTTVPDPSAGVLQGIAALLEASGVEAPAVRGVIHGTTLVTNA